MRLSFAQQWALMDPELPKALHPEEHPYEFGTISELRAFGSSGELCHMASRSGSPVLRVAVHDRCDLGCRGFGDHLLENAALFELKNLLCFEFEKSLFC